MNTATRPYRQSARAEQAAETGRRIVAEFRRLLADRWLDEITLDEVAASAGVTVQTVIRRFGGKQGLIEATIDTMRMEVPATRAAAPGEIGAGIAGLVKDYETTGDMVVRILAQESRQPAFGHALAHGRAGHRAWVEALFGPLLPAAKPLRERTIAALVGATDVYMWQILRRDQRRSAKETERVMRLLVDGAIVAARQQAA